MVHDDMLLMIIMIDDYNLIRLCCSVHGCLCIMCYEYMYRIMQTMSELAIGAYARQ